MTPATLHHAAAMAAIHAAAFPAEPWDEASFSRLLEQPGVAGFIDARGGIVLIRCVADEAEILAIGVARTRCGIGGALLRAAIDHAQRQAVKTLYLEVAASNLAARALYRAFGFAAAGKRPNYYADGSDALVLRLPLPA